MYFTYGFGIDFHRKIDAFCSQNLTFLNMLSRKDAFYCNIHRFCDEKWSQNHSKSMSIFFIFLILCYRCIFWCWWARELCGNVLGILQTRKSVKIHVTFRQIHYNKDSNTNDHLLPFVIVTSLLGSWNLCGTIDVSLDLEVRFVWASSMFSSLDVFPSC